MDECIVRTNSGVLKGAKRKTPTGNILYYFKGIPYAEPPIGDLRFKAPVPVKPWNGIKTALVDGEKSLQLNTMSNFQVLGHEDCLYLNVYTPNLPVHTNHLLPVMVFIHGGGFRMGSGNEDDFGPDFFMENDTIIVTVNYRLGIFGFLSLDTPEISGNAGLKDQHLALKWIKENIKHFGGDNNNITLFGISAGGASVEFHLLHAKSEGLFSKAIIQSGSALCPWALNRNPRDYLKKVLDILGVPELNDPKQILNSLNSFDIKDLLLAAFNASDLETKKNGVLFGFGPVIEKKFVNFEGFLTQDPYELLKLGKIVNAPCISSICRDEGSMFTYFYDKHVDRMLEGHYSDYMPHLNLERFQSVNVKLKTLYLETTDDKRKQLHDFLSDLMFVSPLYHSLMLRSKVAKNYMLMFSFMGTLRHDLSIFGFDSSEKTQHGSDLPYLSKLKDMEHLENKIGDADRRVRHLMVKIYTSFAKTGFPDDIITETNLRWEPMNEDLCQILDVNEVPAVIKFPWKQRMEVWENFYG